VDGNRELDGSGIQDALERAALELFDTHGFEQVEIADIAATAGVPEHSFFNHFDRKEDVLFRLRSGRPALFGSLIVQRPREETFWVAFREAFSLLTPYYEANRPRVVRRRRVLRSHHLLRGRALEIEDLWRVAVVNASANRAGRVNPDRSDAVTGAVAMSVFKVAMDAWVASDGRTTLTDLIAQHFELLDGTLSPTAVAVPS
jgi:AcrR family transcriptional regulator